MALVPVPSHRPVQTSPNWPYTLNPNWVLAPGLRYLIGYSGINLVNGQYLPSPSRPRPVTTGMDFSGATQTQLNVNAPLGANSTYTIAVWFQTTQQSTTYAVVGRGANTLYIGAQSTTSMLFYDGNISLTINCAVRDGKPHLVLITSGPIRGVNNAYCTVDGLPLTFGANTNITAIDQLGFDSQNSDQFRGQILMAGIWNRDFTDNEIRTLYQPQTRWDGFIPQPQLPYLVDAPSIPLDTPPTQAPRPRYLGLNAFSPQAQGLVGWMPAVDGTFVQARTPSTAANQILPKTVPLTQWTSRAIVSSPSVPSDFGAVPQTYFRANTPASPLPDVVSMGASIPTEGLGDLSIVYWIYPLASTFAEATYWSIFQESTGSNVMKESSVKFENGIGFQTLTFSSDPHLRGRWQMITVSRTLGGIQVWRDQTLVASMTGTGTTLTAVGVPEFLIGSDDDAGSGVTHGVNALWADFRIYNRAWTQADVQYAYQPHTRWDYYWTPPALPYRPIPIPGGGVVTTFLSRLASLGAG